MPATKTSSTLASGTSAAGATTTGAVVNNTTGYNVLYTCQITNGATPPTLFGRRFHHFDAPNRYDLPPFYALHAWIWDHNPAGVFESFNPRVSCTNAAALP